MSTFVFRLNRQSFYHPTIGLPARFLHALHASSLPSLPRANVPSRTTLACSKVKALSGIFHLPAGDSPAIYPCNLGKHSRSSSRSRLFQHPVQHSARSLTRF